LQIAAVAPRDTNLARLYYDIGEMYEDNDFEKAKDYYLKVGNLSEQLDWNTGRYLYSAGFSLMLMREGLADSALVVLLQALELAKKEKNEGWIADININTGNAYTKPLSYRLI
jgi:tetratricopeptide (TPR) repeat protein